MPNGPIDFSDLQIPDTDVSRGPIDFSDLALPQQPIAGPIDFSDLRAAPAQQPPKVSEVESLGRGLAQGVTFGFADEIAGALESAFTSKTYRQARDESRQAFERAEKDNPALYVTGEIGGGIGSAFVPGLGWLNAGRSAGALAATGAAAGALQGAGRAEELADVPKAATVGAGVGAATGAAIGGLMKFLRGAKLPDSTKNMVQSLELDNIQNATPGSSAQRTALANYLNETDPSLGIYRKAAEAAQKPMPPTEKLLENKGFIRLLTRAESDKPMTKALEKHAQEIFNGMDEAQQKASWANFQFGQQLKKEIATHTDEIENRISGNLKKSFTTKFEDPLFVARKIDSELGLNTEDAVMQVHEALNRAKVDAAPFAQRIDKLAKQTNKLFKPGEVADILNTSPAKRGVLNSEKQAIISEWDNLAKDARELLNQRGLRVQELAGGGYMPSYRTDAYTMYTNLADKLTSWPPTKETMSALMDLNNGQDVTSLRQAKRLVDGLLDKEVLKKQMGSEASATFEREGLVPVLLQEKDPAKAMMRYVTGNLKAAHMRDAYDKLYTNINALRGAGLKDSADYLEKYTRQISGQPSDYYAFLLSQANKWRVGVDKVFGDMSDAGLLKQTAKQTAKSAPDVVDWMTTLIYPNAMGWNVHAPLRNMTQTWATTVPELGGGYGFGVGRRGWARALRAMAKENPSEFLKGKGLAADTNVIEGARKSLESELYKIPGLGKMAQGIDWLGEKGMALYSGSDTANRYITWHMAEAVADDLLKGTAGARKFAATLPGGIRAQTSAAIKAGNKDALHDLLGRYLISKTQFNYGKAGLSEFGRDYGRLVSMFTKWPIMLMGDMKELAQTGRKAKILTRYVAPLVLMAGAHNALREMDAYDNPVMRTLVGRNVTSWAPASAIIGIRTPPLIDLPLKGLQGLSQAAAGEVPTAAATMSKAITPFVPVWGAIDIVKGRYKE